MVHPHKKTGVAPVFTNNLWFLSELPRLFNRIVGCTPCTQTKAWHAPDASVKLQLLGDSNMVHRVHPTGFRTFGYGVYCARNDTASVSTQTKMAVSHTKRPFNEGVIGSIPLASFKKYRSSSTLPPRGSLRLCNTPWCRGPRRPWHSCRSAHGSPLRSCVFPWR